METRVTSAHTRSAAYARWMWLLTLVFALRVAGQGVQSWAPQPFLPDFDEFQGSNLPYPVLLVSQLAILMLMVYLCRRMQVGSLLPSRRTGVVLTWFGGIYMIVALGRMAIGVLIPDAGTWFTAWIPAVFHVVLAAFVVTLAVYHAESPGEG